MHWAKHGGYRAVFGIASFIPLGVVVAVAVWAQRDPVVDRLLSFDFDMLQHGPRATVIRFCVAMGFAVVFQIAMTTIVALHMEKREDRDLDPGNKIMWIVLCAFVGSIFLPLFYFRKLRRYR
jgi:hypothetical protein